MGLMIARNLPRGCLPTLGVAGAKKQRRFRRCCLFRLTGTRVLGLRPRLRVKTSLPVGGASRIRAENQRQLT